jgi:hypothetical protein
MPLNPEFRTPEPLNPEPLNPEPLNPEPPTENLTPAKRWAIILFWAVHGFVINRRK